ncbi:MAG: ASCH domain-containing protein [Myxococcales bacterium]|nr:ASCH domain-containing protein [Myxococcales bacterium]
MDHRATRLACDVPPGQRALTAIAETASRELGCTLGIPLGVRTPETTPELLFLVPHGGQRRDWASLAHLAATDDRGFAFYVEAMLGGWAPPRQALEVFSFGNTPEMAATLAHLVIKGVKRGTAGWQVAAEREGSVIPRAGQISIVTDGYGHALCAIRTERVERLRFDQIEARHAWIEGEGDRTLEDWREGHLRYFHAEAEQLGLAFTEDAAIFFEHFRVLAVFGRADP